VHDDDIQDMRINLAIRQERRNSMQWYWLVAALPVAGVLIGLIWAAFSPAPASPPHPRAIVAQAPPPAEPATRPDSAPARGVAAGRMVSADKLLTDVQADLEKAGFKEMTEEIRRYESTMMTLGRCRLHNRTGFEASRAFYEGRNKAAYDEWRQRLRDLRNANLPSADASDLEIMMSAANGEIARQAVATMAIAEFDMGAPAVEKLSATECATLRNEVQSGKHDVRRPGP
jgi:hypothetical protein